MAGYTKAILCVVLFALLTLSLWYVGPTFAVIIALGVPAVLIVKQTLRAPPLSSR